VSSIARACSRLAGHLLAREGDSVGRLLAIRLAANPAWSWAWGFEAKQGVSAIAHPTLMLVLSAGS
jgi:hypothetical protein